MFNWAPCARLYTASDSPQPLHSVSFWLQRSKKNLLSSYANINFLIDSMEYLQILKILFIVIGQGSPASAPHRL